MVCRHIPTHPVHILAHRRGEQVHPGTPAGTYTPGLFAAGKIQLHFSAFTPAQNVGNFIFEVPGSTPILWLCFP